MERRFFQLLFSICTDFRMDLTKAAKTNNLERVRLLVEQGAEKDHCDEHGCTPLWWASCYGYIEMARYLVELSATLDKANNYGGIPLTAAASNGHLEVCRYLLEQGTDRDKATDSGWSPLHLSAYNGHLVITMLLMSYGADLNARNNDGDLPIDVAETKRSKRPSATSPDAAWMRHLASKLPSTTDIPTQPHPLRPMKKGTKKRRMNRATRSHDLTTG